MTTRVKTRAERGSGRGLLRCSRVPDRYDREERRLQSAALGALARPGTPTRR
jgi:hypothetical protein